MQLSEEDSTPHYSSSSISPMEEDAVLSFTSSQSSYYMVPTTLQGHHGPSFINEYNYFPQQQQGYSSGSDSHSSLMYPSSPTDGNPFMSAVHHPFNTATPSPTSSMSSKSMTNFTGSDSGTMYLRPTTTTTAQDCIISSYSDLEFSRHQQQDGGSSNSDFDTNERKTKTTSSGSHGLANDHTHSTAIENYKNSSTDYKTKKPACANKGGDSAREKTKKRCSNCHSIHSPSWRRSISKYTKGALLCNACGL
jgi:hypothetical protein